MSVEWIENTEENRKSLPIEKTYIQKTGSETYTEHMLVTDGNTIFTAYRIVMVDTADKSRNFAKWCAQGIYVDRHDEGFYDISITHWATLPAIPKGENK